jgi:Raf kinase inhibitor-like YbhB/YbcL family protein
MSLTISSPDFTAGGSIPSVHTCEGANTSPALSWSGVPAGTKSLTLIVDDPDAPDPAAPQRTWVHWVLYNIPAVAVELIQAVPTLPETPSGARHGRNTAGDMAYAGPCPPPGKPHRYFFRLFALDTLLSLTPGASRAELEEAMNQHILGQGELMGTYQHRP